VPRRHRDHLESQPATERVGGHHPFDDALGEALRGNTAVAVGSSGAGKSTLLNALLGEAVQATGGLDRVGVGRHTTTRREMRRGGDGLVVIDTPGMRELGLYVVGDGLEAAFADVLAVAQGCRFRDCTHSHEAGCAVREALDAGALEHAERLLGRPYCISGRVIHGEKLGRKIGYATANIQLKRLRAPLSGIFVVTVDGIADQPLEGVASLGVRPTVHSNGVPTLEVYIFDFAGDLYRAHLRVNFLHKLRDEAKFDSLEALTAQIARDVADAKAHHAALHA